MAACRRRSAPYGGAARLTAAPEPELLDPKPAHAYAPWIRPLSDYERREAHEFACSRYG